MELIFFLISCSFIIETYFLVKDAKFSQAFLRFCHFFQKDLRPLFPKEPKYLCFYGVNKIMEVDVRPPRLIS